jgi:hypothetical protein
MVRVANAYSTCLGAVGMWYWTQTELLTSQPDISVELIEHSLVSFVLFALVIVLFFQDIRYRLQILLYGPFRR